MSKYIVTGGDGFIGGNIAKATNGVSYDIKSGNDILDINKLRNSLVGGNGIFHCAAKISVPESIKSPDLYHQTNVIGTQNVVTEAEKLKLKIVFSSSAAVYGESKIPTSESAVLSPLSPYAENKKDGESLLSKSKVPHVVLRYFNAYGPGQSKEYAGVITTFIKQALSNSDIVIYEDGQQVRDFIFIDDIVRANERAMQYENKHFEIFNIASGVGTSIQELAEKIIKLTNSSSIIRYENSRQGDIVYSHADVSRARDVLDWKPSVSLDEGLQRTIDFYSGNH